jgi:hypothetical protein
MDADGDFVVAWNRCHLVTTSMGVECTGYDVFAQRYNAAGQPQGPEFQVNSFTTGYQGMPFVAMSGSGNFVMAWAGDGTGDPTGIFARRYDAAGDPQAAEFRVNTEVAGDQLRPSVAMDADGDFLVAWESLHCIDNSCLYEVSSQRFDAAGVPQGDEVEINVASGSSNKRAAVAMDAVGNYVLTWQGWWDGDSWGIFAQRYNEVGEPQGGMFPVNTTTIDQQRFPDVAMDADGEFVVAWHSLGQDGDGYGIFAQRYNAAGEPQGGEFQVNTTSAGGQYIPSVAVDADGDFVVIWSGYGPGDASGVFAQRYNTYGEPEGGEVRVNTTTAGTQGLTYWYGTDVVMDADGDFVAAWQSSDGQDGDDHGIFAQRFDGAERVEGDFDGDGKADLLWRNTATGNTVVWLMDGETRLAEGSIALVPSAWRIAGTGDFNGDGKADVLWRNSATGNAIVWQMNGLERTAAQSIGAPPLAWTVEQLRDTNGDGLSDIVWRNTGTGTTVVWRMSGFTKVASEAIGNVNSDWQLR